MSAASSSRMRSITVSGDIGSGKSTVARGLARGLGWPLRETGTLQRSAAARLGLDTLELNRRAETEPSLDDDIDRTLKDIDRSPEPNVVDSRMAFFFLKNAFHLYLYCEASVAAERIFLAGRATESYRDIAGAMEGIRRRHDSEMRRFRDLYGVEIEDLRQYDCVLDTSFAQPDEIGRLVIDAAGDFSRLPKALICPRSLISLRSLPGDCVRQAGSTVKLAFADRKFYICGGHDALRAALANKDVWVAAEIAFFDGDSVSGIPLRQFIRSRIGHAFPRA